MNKIDTQKKILIVFKNQFQVQKRISSGSFGVVFAGTDKKTDESIAIKVEKENKNANHQTLLQEANIMQRLCNVQGVPKLIWSGQDEKYNILVMEFLGRDLSYYMEKIKIFSLKTVLMIALQVLTIIENIHNKDVIHRDLKPENLLLSHDMKQIYLTDFGISKVENFLNKAQKQKKVFIGTSRYASIAAHQGLPISRGDELQSLGYILIYFLKGTLPWQNVKSKGQEKIKKVGQIKRETDDIVLCQDLPLEFIRYFKYVKNLKINEQPDYDFLRQIFQNLGQRLKLTFDNKFDWLSLYRRKSLSPKKNTDSHSPNTNDPVTLLKPPMYRKSADYIKQKPNNLAISIVASSLFSQNAQSKNSSIVSNNIQLVDDDLENLQEDEDQLLWKKIEFLKDSQVKPSFKNNSL